MRGYILTPNKPFHTAAGAAFGTFTTRQDVSPFPLPVVQGNDLEIGQKIVVEAEGEFSTTGTPTLSIGTYIGTVAGVITTVLAEYTAAATGSAAAAWPWSLSWRGIVLGPLGATCSVLGQGAVILGSSLVAVTTLPIPSTQALRTITWDTTIARAIGICATWGTSSASNTIKTNNLSVYLF
jgi:hypothetical protein